MCSSITEHSETNVINDHRFDLLKTAAIYGANASGKSNLVKALYFMKRYILNSVNNLNGTINVEPFMLSSECDNEPAYFNISFLHEDILYNYGFRITQEEVLSEWLTYTGRKKGKLFERTGDKYTFGSYFKNGKRLVKFVRKNSLLLTVAAQLNETYSLKVIDWFTHKLHFIHGLFEDYSVFTINKLQDKEFKKKLLNLLSLADIDISDILVYKIKGEKLIETLPEDIKFQLSKEIPLEHEFVNLSSVHNKYDKQNQICGEVVFDFENAESEGTKKFLKLAGPLLDVIENSRTLVIDELDTRLHPLLTKSFIQLFNSFKNEKSQLIFTTHDTGLLDRKVLRRDQIWFAQKNEYGVTDLYCLLKLKIRSDASYEKDYVSGKYGAVPFTGNMNFFNFADWEYDNVPETKEEDI